MSEINIIYTLVQLPGFARVGPPNPLTPNQPKCNQKRNDKKKYWKKNNKK
jgi:hypothetical protein